MTQQIENINKDRNYFLKKQMKTLEVKAPTNQNEKFIRRTQHQISYGDNKESTNLKIDQ